MNLFERQLANDDIEPAEDLYRVVFEAPDSDLAAIYCPAPKFVAMLMKGGIASPIEAYLDDQQRYTDWLAEGHDPTTFSWDKIGGAKHPSAAPIGPLTHEQAIEYLVMKDVPREVWDRPEEANYKPFRIVLKSAIPTDRTYRNAWSFEA